MLAYRVTFRYFGNTVTETLPYGSPPTKSQCAATLASTGRNDVTEDDIIRIQACKAPRKRGQGRHK